MKGARKPIIGLPSFLKRGQGRLLLVSLLLVVVVVFGGLQIWRRAREPLLEVVKGGYWEEINKGLNSASVTTLAIDPSDPAIIYAGVESDGVFKSSDGGSSWGPINKGLTSPMVNTLVVDNTNPTTVYAGTRGKGVFKSTDGGLSWTPTGEGLDNPNIITLTLDTANPKILYAGTFEGVFKTLNGGSNWVSINKGLSQEPDEYSSEPFTPPILSIAVDPANTQVVYAGAFGAFFKSLDGGENWTMINVYEGGMWNTVIASLVIDPVSTTTIYAGTGAGVFKSTDGGTNWVYMKDTDVSEKSDGFKQSGGSPALAIDPSKPFVVYVGVDGGGIFKTSDGGNSWVQVNTGLTTKVVSALVIHPDNTYIIYAGTLGGGVYKSIDGGSSWSSTPLETATTYTVSFNPQSPATFYAGTAGGLFKSTDGGSSWSVMDSGLVNPVVLVLVVDPVTSANLYAGVEDRRTFNKLGMGVLKSTNGGMSWSESNSGLTNLGVQVLTINPKNPEVIYAGTYSGVYKTTDGASSWNVLSGSIMGVSTLPDITSLTVDSINPDIVYAGSIGGIVYKSIDDGTSWESVSIQGTKSTVKAIVVDPVNSKILYAGAKDGLFKTIDGGVSWSSISSGLTNTNIYAIVINPVNPQVLYVGTAGGVFKSTDGGSTWREMNTGLRNTLVLALTLNPENPDIIYVGTAGGVYRWVPEIRNKK